MQAGTQSTNRNTRKEATRSAETEYHKQRK
jgi:hypothetical protein